MKFRMFSSLSVVLLAWTGFAANWTYDTSANTITDGNWTLKVFTRSDNYIGLGSSFGATTDGNAYVSGAGDLDLTRPILTSAGVTYLLTDVTTGALAIGDGNLTSVKFPRSLGAFLRMGGSGASYAGNCNWPRCLVNSAGTVSTSITNIVMDCPQVLHVDTASSVLWNLSNGGTQLKNLTLRLPKAQSMGKRAFFCANSTDCRALADVDVSTWDLTGLETIGDEAMMNICATGVLDLARVETIGTSAFANDVGLDGVELSANRCTLKTLGAAAFQNATALKHVTIGGDNGLVLGANAFNGCSSLVSVIFTGAKPTFDLGSATTPVFGADAQAARSIAFYVNTNRADWAQVVSGATPLSAAEQAAFAAAHPELPVPFGVVGAEVFHTATEQLLGCAERYYSLETACDTFFGDSVSVTTPANCRRNGKIRAGSRIAVTAEINAAKNGAFAAWCCDVDDTQRTANPLVFAIERDTYLFARITHPWTFDASAKTLSNGNWTLNAYVSSGSNLSLGLASGGTTSGDVFNTTDGEGVLDLGGAISDASGKTYKITAFNNNLPACPSSGKGMGMTAFFSPGTLTTVYRSWGANVGANLGWPTLRLMVLDEPCSCAFAGWSCTLSMQWELERLVLRLPNVYHFNGNSGAFFWGADAFKTDVGWWRLDSVHTIGSMFARLGQIDDAGGTNPGAAFYGVLKLPKAGNIQYQAFVNCRYLDGVDLGSDTTSLAITNNAANHAAAVSYAFARCRNLKQVRLQGQAIALRSAAFIECPRLKGVALVGGVPTVDDAGLASTKIGNVFSGAGEKGIVFSVPAESPAWADVIAGATAATPAEAAAFKGANPALPTPTATVAASVFRSDAAEYLASSAAMNLTLDYDLFFGDRVVVSGAGEKDVFGGYPDGTTFTAVPSATGTFAGWYGDVADEHRLDRTVTLPADGKAKHWLYARFTHPWTLKTDGAGAKYIDNGNWKIKVATVNATTIELPSVSVGEIYHADNAGSGVLDLGGGVVDAADASKRYTISYLGGGRSSYVNRALKTFLTPGSLTTSGWGQLFAYSDYRYLKTFIADEPNYTGVWATWTFSGQNDLSRMVLRLPKIANLGDGGAFWNAYLPETDLGWWRLQGLTSVLTRMFRCHNNSGETGNDAYGTLELPSVRTIGTGGFRKCPNLEGLVLGTNKNSYVTLIHTNAIMGCDRLTKLVIGSKEDIFVSELSDVGKGAPGDDGQYNRKSSENWPSWKEVTFLGPAPNARAFGNLFANVAAKVGAKDCVIYASGGQRGWAQVVDKTLNDEEMAADKPEGVLMGVWRAGLTREEGGKAWVVWKNSPWDPKGSCLFIR